jgi:hypothetical protein
LEYYIVYDGLSGPATAAHFHEANAGINGNVVLNLSDSISGNVIKGSSTFSVYAFNTMLEGGYYINVHTLANPNGEIRGQIYKNAREGFVFELNGGQEVPSVTTQATGTGMVSIDRDETSAHYMVVYSGLEGNFTASHFHHAKPGVSGGVIYNITSSYNPFGGAFGYWDETSTPIFDAAPLMYNNEVYLNVHSDQHASGEIRGNLVPVGRLFTELPFDPEFGDNLMLAAVLTGDDEVPPVTTDANALATLYFDGDLTKAKINITATKLSGPSPVYISMKVIWEQTEAFSFHYPMKAIVYKVKSPIFLALTWSAFSMEPLMSTFILLPTRMEKFADSFTWSKIILSLPI